METAPTRSRPYGPLELIDWDREYAQLAEARKQQAPQSTRLRQLIYSNLHSILLISSSVTIALLTIGIDYVSMYLHGLRTGVCKQNVLIPAYECDDLADWSTYFLFFTKSSVLRRTNDLIVYIMIVLVLALFGALLASKHIYIAHGGIPEIKSILSGTNIPDFLNIKMIMSKVASLVLVVSSGLFLGIEGPLVHISMGVMQFFMNLLPLTQNEAVKREYLSSAVAIGIGLAFNAPIGGVLFGLEQIHSAFPVDKLMWNAFICSTIGVTLLQKLHPYMEMNIDDMFTVSLKNNWLSYETIPYMFLGLLCGVLGIFFCKLNIYFATFRQQRLDNDKLKIVEVVSIALAGAVVGRMSNYSMFSLPKMLQQLFNSCTDDSDGLLCSKDAGFPWRLSLTLVAGIMQSFFFSAYSYGCNVPGGLLLPSLVIGGSVGRLVGVLLEAAQNQLITSALHLQCLNEKKCISVASYAVVGAGSFAAAVFKMNITMVVILFELTGAVTYMIPIMLGVFCARFLNDMIVDQSIYEMWLEISNLPYVVPDIEDRLSNPDYAVKTCASVMRPAEEIHVFEDGTLTLADIERAPEMKGYPVVRDGELYGYVTSYSLRRELAFLKEQGVVSFDTVVTFGQTQSGYHTLEHLLTRINLLQVVNGDTKLLTACQIMDQLILDSIFVCYPGSYKLQGIIYREMV
ncbi:hypothetical protein KL949_005243 [Ogataea haglerorum]|nr:hypothetical protein KL913_005206 [Ogataea haglerorum]KAG7713494.1 hypothetical protein KL949_005243 [Ogataea haglerorum]KAG7733432.1 hypothetical protein KL932_005213 [Ogataea haglerorum]